MHYQSPGSVRGGAQQQQAEVPPFLRGLRQRCAFSVALDCGLWVRDYHAVVNCLKRIEARLWLL